LWRKDSDDCPPGGIHADNGERAFGEIGYEECATLSVEHPILCMK
jgi:hypothetical protein